MTLAEYLDNLEALANAATEKPWTFSHDLIVGAEGKVWDHTKDENPWANEKDLIFVTNARTDIPKLVKIIRAMTKQCSSCGSGTCCPDRAGDVVGEIQKILDGGGE